MKNRVEFKEFLVIEFRYFEKYCFFFSLYLVFKKVIIRFFWGGGGNCKCS